MVVNTFLAWPLMTTGSGHYLGTGTSISEGLNSFNAVTTVLNTVCTTVQY